MKRYNVYFNPSGTPRLMRSGLTEEQMDKFWNSLKFWQKQSLKVEEVDDKQITRGDDYER